MKKNHRVVTTSAATAQIATTITVLLFLLLSTTTVPTTVTSFSPIPVSSPGVVALFRTRTASSAAGVFALQASSSPSSSLDDVAVLAKTNSSSSNNKSTITASSSSRIQQQEQVKGDLLDLLPRMTGKVDEFKLVERYVNQLEASYEPVQTLDFLNLLQQGDWQLLLSTNLVGKGSSNSINPRQFRLRELYQTVTCHGLQGTVDTHAIWDLAENKDANFLASGSFTAEHSYEIKQGARLMVTLTNHLLKPFRGSTIPQDVPGLVGLLHRAMPLELFDASHHAMDTTFLDANLRIVRFTGPSKLEGTRDIFIRRGSLTINPIAAAAAAAAAQDNNNNNKSSKNQDDFGAEHDENDETSDS